MENKENDILLDAILENLHKSTLTIPVIKGYKVAKDPGDAIMIAISDDQSVQQFLEEGILEDGETFEDRLKKVIQVTEKSMVENGLSDEKLLFIEEIENPPFHFHLYLQDNIKDNKQVRQINAYFLEPESNCFYEISLAAPPMEIKDVNDFVASEVYLRLKMILNHVKYNDKNPIK